MIDEKKGCLESGNEDNKVVHRMTNGPIHPPDRLLHCLRKNCKGLNLAETRCGGITVNE